MQSRNKREGWYFGKMKLPDDMERPRFQPGKARRIRTRSKWAGVRYSRFPWGTHAKQK